MKLHCKKKIYIDNCTLAIKRSLIHRQTQVDMKNDDDVKKKFLVFLGELLKEILLFLGNYEKIKFLSIQKFKEIIVFHIRSDLKKFYKSLVFFLSIRSSFIIKMRPLFKLIGFNPFLLLLLLDRSLFIKTLSFLAKFVQNI